MATYYTAADRCPRLPSRDQIPVAELNDYDYLVDVWIEPLAHRRDLVDGKPWGMRHFETLAVAPAMGVALMRLGETVTDRQGTPGTVSAADHEMIDQVLALDSGYFGLVAFHTPIAIEAGVRIEALQAIADGREDDLTADERQQVEFIRAVRDGTMTDDTWNRMVRRLGTDRGVVEFVTLVLVVLFHHRFSWALGAPEMRPADWRQMLDDFKTGRRHPQDSLAAVRSARAAALEAWGTP